MEGDLLTFDERQALTLRDAIKTGKLDFCGRRPSLEKVQRYAREGCRPVEGGPLVVLRTVIRGRRRLTMASWLDAFVAARKQLILDHVRRLPTPVSDAAVERNANAALGRMRKKGLKV